VLNAECTHFAKTMQNDAAEFVLLAQNIPKTLESDVVWKVILL